MKKKYLYILLITLSILMFIDFNNLLRNNYYNNNIEDEIYSKVETGDLLFIKSNDPASRTYSSLNKNVKFSTVKIIVKNKDGLFFIESSGDDLSKNNMGLFLTNFNIIYTEYKNLEIFIYRPKKTEKNKKRVNFLLSEINKNKIYKYDYTLNFRDFSSFNCLKLAFFVYRNTFMDLKKFSIFNFDTFDNIKFKDMKLIYSKKLK